MTGISPRLFADLHIHSRFSRATSRDLTPENLLRWARRKGIGLLGTGDFTHPGWLADLRGALEEDGNGFLVAKPEVAARAGADVPASCRGEVRFVLSVEISSIWRKGERVRKVHTVFLVPSLDAAERFGTALGRLGNVTSDGRPILGLDPRRLLALARDAHPDAIAIPAHVWTPHFSIFGAMSGFDSLEECFEDLSGEVFALETGLSSDIAMNRRWSALDRFALISSSDAHSPSKLGREATMLEGVGSFADLVTALKGGGRAGTGTGTEDPGPMTHDPGRPSLLGTVEFFPEEGKYHLAGHRKCGVRVTPSEGRKVEGRCPACGQRLTPGVLDRVDSLADRPEGPVPGGFPPQHCLIPLEEVLAEALEVGTASRQVGEAYGRTLAAVGPELDLLGWRDLADVEAVNPLLAEALRRMRDGRVHLDAGFDGEYGRIRVFAPGEVEALAGQGMMFGLGERAPMRRRAAAVAPAPAAPLPVEALPPVDGGSLTGEQRQAVEARDGATLVVAGPGTGKTRVLVAAAEAAVRGGCPPAAVLAITFSNRAAEEARERLDAALAGVRGRPQVATFHAFALGELSRRAEARGEAPPVVAGREEVLTRLRALLPDDGDRAGGLLEARARGDVLPAGDRATIDELEDGLRAEGRVDLDGLVPALVREIRADVRTREGLAGRFRLVLVDELQDIGRDQLELLRLLRPHGSAVLAVGDPDQAIYGFRGAEPRAFDAFAESWPGTRIVRLARSHRLTPEVAAVAGHVMRGAASASVGGSAGGIDAARPAGTPVRMYRGRGPLDEAGWVARRIRDLLGGTEMTAARADRGHLGLADIAVLGRTHQALDAVARVLEEAGIPAERASDRPLWDTPWVAAMLAGLASAPPGADAVATALAALKQAGTIAPPRERDALMRRLDGMDAASALRKLQTLREVDAFGLDPERVRLLTIHAAKGLEFDAVFVVGCEDGVLPPAPLPGRPVDTDEERRLLFVAATRARSVLHLSWPTAGGRGRGTMTPFLEGIDPAVATNEDGTEPRRGPGPQQQVLL
jgi:DNA helicase-2/ATP-dependent DNA helicase PcrA